MGKRSVTNLHITRETGDDGSTVTHVEYTVSTDPNWHDEDAEPSPVAPVDVAAPLSPGLAQFFRPLIDGDVKLDPAHGEHWVRKPDPSGHPEPDERHATAGLYAGTDMMPGYLPGHDAPAAEPPVAQSQPNSYQPTDLRGR